MSEATYVEEVLARGVQDLLEAVYSIWGTAPTKDRGVCFMQPDPNPITTGSGAGDRATGVIKISTAGGFVCTKHAVYCTDNSNTADRNVYFTFQAGDTDRRVSNDANGPHLECAGGSDEWPVIYPVPAYFEGAAQITVQITNVTAAIHKAYVSLIGWRVWNVAMLNLTRRAGG